MELVDSLGGLKSFLMVVVALVAWSIRLEVVVKNNARSAIDHTKELKMLFHKSDDLEAELKILKGRFDIVSGMMSPERQREHWQTITSFEKDIEHLKQEIDRCLAD